MLPRCDGTRFVVLQDSLSSPLSEKEDDIEEEVEARLLRAITVAGGVSYCTDVLSFQ